MTKTYMYVAVLIAAIGGIVVGTSVASDTTMNTASVLVPLMGHVTLTVEDENGMLKQYIESDNMIVNLGEDCVSKLLFSGAANTGDIACIGPITEPFTTIALGTSNVALAEEQTSLSSPISSVGLEPAVGTVAWTNATGGTSASVKITHSFTATGPLTNIVETGLFNGTDTNHNGMFARNLFSSVNVDTDDVLTVEWTVTVGN